MNSCINLTESRYPDALTEHDKRILQEHPGIAQEIATQNIDEYVARNQHLGTVTRLQQTHAYACELTQSRA